MSVQVLRVRFPGLSLAVVVERSRRQRKERPPSNDVVKVGYDHPVWRSPNTVLINPNLIKFQI